jgi:hypothetical protein
MSFDVNAFLAEWGGELPSGSEGVVLPMMLEVGIGVFAGSDSEFFPVTNPVLGKVVNAKATERVKQLGDKAFATGAVRQTWFAEQLGRDKQPAWKDGKWEEMKCRRTVTINGVKQETGDWVLFKSQWMGDEAPVTSEMFGKKLWVHAVYKRHPDFNEEFPNKYTTQWDRATDLPVLDDKGKPRPQFIRVVKEVIGETREQAEAWYAEHIGGETGSAKDESSLESDLMALFPASLKGDFDDAAWLECARSVFNEINDHVDDFSGWNSVGITDEVIGKIRELTV